MINKWYECDSVNQIYLKFLPKYNTTYLYHRDYYKIIKCHLSLFISVLYLLSCISEDLVPNVHILN